MATSDAMAPVAAVSVTPVQSFSAEDIEAALAELTEGKLDAVTFLDRVEAALTSFAVDSRLQLLRIVEKATQILQEAFLTDFFRALEPRVYRIVSRVLPLNADATANRETVREIVSGWERGNLFQKQHSLANIKRYVESYAPRASNSVDLSNISAFAVPSAPGKRQASDTLLMQSLAPPGLADGVKYIEAERSSQKKAKIEQGLRPLGEDDVVQFHETWDRLAREPDMDTDLFWLRWNHDMLLDATVMLKSRTSASPPPAQVEPHASARGEDHKRQSPSSSARSKPPPSHQTSDASDSGVAHRPIRSASWQAAYTQDMFLEATSRSKAAPKQSPFSPPGTPMTNPSVGSPVNATGAGPSTALSLFPSAHATAVGDMRSQPMG